MDQVLELSPHGLKRYGGNYDDYLAQREVEDEAVRRHVVAAEQQLKRDRREAQAAQERQARRAARGKRLRARGGVPKVVLNGMRERSEKTTSRLAGIHEHRVADAQVRRDEARARLRPQNVIQIDLGLTDVPAGKQVVALIDVSFAYLAGSLASRGTGAGAVPAEVDPAAGGAPHVEHAGPAVGGPLQHREQAGPAAGGAPLLEDINLSIVGPRRVAVLGPNGSGKTTLIKLMLGELAPTRGLVRRGVREVAWLDQRVALLERQASVLDNFRRLNPGLEPELCRLRLGRFLFRGEAALRRVADLSGGERMRAALACVLAGDTPPRLLVLDEPTNNLDLDSIEQVESALQSYQGALVVVSHDQRFLEHIGIDTALTLGAGAG
jgi:ATPase subunit of ABC transporter with duplicated ATPase domains